MMAKTLGHAYRCLVGDALARAPDQVAEPDFQIDKRAFLDFVQRSLGISS